MAYNNRDNVFKGSDKTQRYTKDSFVKELIKKPLKITLINGMIVQGILLELGMFDAKIQTSTGPLIILKGAIATVKVIQ